MKRGIGFVGSHCQQYCKDCKESLAICEHNQRDASINPQDVCTGYGFEGECHKGEYFTHGDCLRKDKN